MPPPPPLTSNLRASLPQAQYCRACERHLDDGAIPIQTLPSAGLPGVPSGHHEHDAAVPPEGGWQQRVVLRREMSSEEEEGGGTLGRSVIVRCVYSAAESCLMPLVASCVHAYHGGNDVEPNPLPGISEIGFAAANAELTPVDRIRLRRERARRWWRVFAREENSILRARRVVFLQGAVCLLICGAVAVVFELVTTGKSIVGAVLVGVSLAMQYNEMIFSRGDEEHMTRETQLERMIRLGIDEDDVSFNVNRT